MKHENFDRLKRVDLLELLIAQGKEIERLTEELDRAQAELQKRRLILDTAGSIADAALQISGVFQAAQEAADRYLENIQAMEKEAKTRYRSTWNRF